MRLCLVVTVAAVALTACTNAAILGPDSNNEGETAGNTALFCRAWPEARRTVANAIEGDEPRFDWYDSALSLDQVMEEYDRAVPVEIRAEWDRAYDTYVRVSDLAFTTGFGESVLRSDHVEMVFGAAGPEPVFARTMDAVAAIDEWSVTACGDFCSRWPELEDAVMLGGEHSVIHGGPEEVKRSIAKMEGAIRAGNVLVPPALADAWETAAALKSDFLAMYLEYGLEEGGALQGEAGEQLFREWVGVDSWEASEMVEQFPEAVAAWVDSNCDSASLTGGAPGTLSVRIRPHADLMGRTILLVLLPIGTEFGAVENSDDYLGAWCTEQPEAADEFEREVARQARESGRDPQEVVDEWLQPESLRPVEQVTGNNHVGSVCHLLRHGDEITVPGGPYELFAGTYVGEPGSYGLYFGVPERCAQVTVSIDGNTTIDLPELEECDLEPIGRPEEIARRTAAPFEPGGTLWVELPSAFGPEEFIGCEMSAVLLPVGTTLNDIGRGDVWPFAGVRMGLQTERHIDDPAAIRRGNESGLVPILGVGPTGSPPRVHNQVGGDRAWDATFPAPAPLAAGSYDLRLSQEWCMRGEHVDDPDNENARCASIIVEVDGDTVVAVPEFEACR
jgi:hypothetical protein